MNYTVRDLLQLEELDKAEFKGTKQSLSKFITGITIIDSPYIARWLKGGEILLTSFHAVSTFDEESLSEWAENLADKKISALIVKNPNEGDTIPEVIEEVCAKRNIAMIVIHRDVPFISIIRKVTRKLFSQDVERLEYFREINHRFTELSIRNMDDEVIIQTLESLIGNPVTIYNELFTVLATTDSEVELFYENDKFKERDDSKDSLFPIYRRNVIFPKLQDRLCEQIMIPITTVNQTRVNLVISAVNSNFNEFDFIAIENAATALSLNLAKKIAVSEVEKKYKNEIIDDLLSGELKNDNDIKERAFNINFDLNSRSAVVVFSLNFKNKDIDSKNHQRYYNMLINNIDYYLKDAIIRERFNQVIVIWPIHSGQNNIKKEMSYIKKSINLVLSKFESTTEDATVLAGIGTIANTVFDLPRSHTEAQEVTNMLTLFEPVKSFEELGVYRLLYQFKHDNNKLDEFIPHSLRRLLNYHKSNRKQLIETLDMYLQSQQNISRTADRLFIHYKTVTYRLDKIKEITQMDYEDANEMLSVQVGLKILEINH